MLLEVVARGDAGTAPAGMGTADPGVVAWVSVQG